ncbi:MAG: response regulator [PVC group bacterium]|nr:response regulator [PVC group bacterium]
MKKKKVLIIDDDVVVLTVLRDRLIKEDYDVITAGDGQSGMEKIDGECPDIVVLDLVLPDIDGYKVFQYMKQIKKLDTPVIIMTDKLNTAPLPEIFSVDPEAIINKDNNCEMVFEAVKKFA